MKCVSTSLGGSINDGSEYAENQNNRCGGGPCAPGPEDTGSDRLTEEQACALEQFFEKSIDQVAQEVRSDMLQMDLTKELATFIIETTGADGSSEFVTLNISSGSPGVADLASLYNELNARGFNDGQIRAFIHSHPASTHSSASRRAAEDFINQFPSVNDYIAFETFANNVGVFGNETIWRRDFRGYVLGPDNELREYSGFEVPTTLNETRTNLDGLIPAVGTPLRMALETESAVALADAENRCVGG